METGEAAEALRPAHDTDVSTVASLERRTTFAGRTGPHPHASPSPTRSAPSRAGDPIRVRLLMRMSCRSSGACRGRR
jgi:hypothetical protein